MSDEKVLNDSTEESQVSSEEVEPSPRMRRTRPGKFFLPTDRIAFPKQLDLLRGYAAASGSEKTAVTNSDVASIVGMSPSTTTLANAFFSSMGFLNKGNGGYVPSDEVFSFSRAHDWEPETAGHKLAPTIEEAWFSKALLPKLAFRSLTEDEALTNLAEAAEVGPRYKNQIRTLLDYMEVAGLIKRDGEQIQKAEEAGIVIGEIIEEYPPDPVVPSEKADREIVKSSLSELAEGGVAFNVSIRVDMAEFSDWSAERIAAFFDGLAKVLTAKGGTDHIEKEEAER